MNQPSNGSIFDFNHWLSRLIAYIIDTAIIAIIVGVLWTCTISATPANAFLYGNGLYLITFPLLVGLIEVFYFVILELWVGSSIGKRIMGFQVMQANGAKVTIEKSFIRNISKIYWLLLVLDWMVATLYMGNDKHQKYTDRYAGTTVIATRIPYSSSKPSSNKTYT